MTSLHDINNSSMTAVEILWVTMRTRWTIHERLLKETCWTNTDEFEHSLQSEKSWWSFFFFLQWSLFFVFTSWLSQRSSLDITIHLHKGLAVDPQWNSVNVKIWMAEWLSGLERTFSKHGYSRHPGWAQYNVTERLVTKDVKKPNG